ncbi:hypothetical protein BDV06DRAFT_228779 [Aspergillus oleicola]
MASKSWDRFGEVHVIDDLDQAYQLADRYASEHVRILIENHREALEKMRNYRALFLSQKGARPVSRNLSVVDDWKSGSWANDAVVHGTNHVLPTRRAARFKDDLWVGNASRRSPSKW